MNVYQPAQKRCFAALSVRAELRSAAIVGTLAILHVLAEGGYLCERTVDAPVDLVHRHDDDDAKDELLGSLSKAFDGWLPLMLKLNEREITEIADFQVVRDVLDEKLTSPLALLTVLLDGIATILTLSCFVGATLLMFEHTGPLGATELALLYCTILFDIYSLFDKGPVCSFNT